MTLETFGAWWQPCPAKNTWMRGDRKMLRNFFWQWKTSSAKSWDIIGEMRHGGKLKLAEHTETILKENAHNVANYPYLVKLVSLICKSVYLQSEKHP